MAVIMAHPELQGLRRWTLATWDAHGLYRQFGFGALPYSRSNAAWIASVAPFIVSRGLGAGIRAH